ncbi:DEAD/DEAH box helicase [Tichowtungia aerotolerans]|uniref:DEAD-box ATP-dependent RNA helicase RhpA n=1 Tax=Tichowtungia aerotolerans TaxID=2697043 RepID=A0A6P1M7B3_9BACT|nr:DEAD/DEAH box helicase [Tichowtungia aerotolerans]QHI69922.1 DEAD/DEAH box helicase [Tichowtungia aerotolerans]
MKQNNAFAALMEPLQRAVAEEGYTTPTPIQQQAIPHLLEGKDLLGCAQTGTGKTAAFTLPLLQEMSQTNITPPKGRPRALILSPTRELAAQIGDSITTYGRHVRVSHTVIFGGVGQNPQVKALQRGVDVVVATPGRLIDLMDQGYIHLDRIELFILDEADRMLDMGFIPAVRKVIAKLPKKRHSLFFSATMPAAVEKLAMDMLRNPVKITIDPGQPTVERITQKMMFVDKGHKDALLIDLIDEHDMDKVIIFSRTKHGANKVVKKLEAAGISSAAIHGNKSQTARTNALAGFKSGKLRALVATDIAARGIDVDGITHVVNYDLPEEPETYVHRIGRTARAGTDGDAVSFCSARERDWLRQIEKMICKEVPVDLTHKYHSETARRATGSDARPEPKGRQGRRRSGGRPSGGGNRRPSRRR